MAARAVSAFPPPRISGIIVALAPGKVEIHVVCGSERVCLSCDRVGGDHGACSWHFGVARMSLKGHLTASSQEWGWAQGSVSLRSPGRERRADLPTLGTPENHNSGVTPEGQP
jgi:hypothetical protein